MWKNLLGASALLLSGSVFVHSLSAAQANSGPSISLATNPIFSGGGYSNSGVTENIPGQSGLELVITDVTLSAQYNYDAEIVFSTSSGVELGRYKTWNYSNYNGPAIIDSHLNSGLRVPENETLIVQVSGRGSYTYSGYKAHP